MNDLPEETPSSMNQSRCWSPEGKMKRPDNRNWAYKSKKERKHPVKNWIDRKVVRHHHPKPEAY